jgi:hypothetical protein
VGLSRPGLDPDALFFCRTTWPDDRPGELVLAALAPLLGRRITAEEIEGDRVMLCLLLSPPPPASDMHEL